MFYDEIASGKWIEVPRSKDTCVVFKIKGKICHIGWMVDNNHFIHILKGSNVAIEKLSNPNWNKRIAGFYLYKGKK